MADSVPITLCILWEGELRAAAKALAALEGCPDSEYPKQAVVALNACLVALHDVTDEKLLVLIGADGVKKRLATTSTGKEKA